MDSDDFALMQALDFTTEDLNANRRGQLGEHQKARLRKQIARYDLMMGIWLALAALTAFASAALMFEAHSSNAWGGFLFAVAFGYIGLTNDGARQKLNADLRQDQTQTVAGWVMPSTTLKGGDTPARLFKLTIDEHIFFVDGKAYPYFQKGTFYRVYFTPRERRILAVERDQ